MNLSKWFHLKTETGEPVKVGQLSLRPQSQSFRVQTPWHGYVYNRPVAVLVEDGQQVERVPIVDVTRIAQLTLLAWAAVFALLRWRAQWQS